MEIPVAQKFLARNLMSLAIRNGTLVPGPCEICGRTDTVDGHHDDYWQPLKVRWLCRYHHTKHHHSLEHGSKVNPDFRRTIRKYPPHAAEHLLTAGLSVPDVAAKLSISTTRVHQIKKRMEYRNARVNPETGRRIPIY